MEFHLENQVAKEIKLLTQVTNESVFEVFAVFFFFLRS